MSKSRFVLICVCVTIFGTQLKVDGKRQLCKPSPKWTVNNGSEPMRQSLGNVTLVTLLNASFKFATKQALSMENMLRFLKSTGLKEFNFIIINANNFEASEKFKELSNKVSFAVYQESDSEKVWDLLDGDKDDMFVYDRCGLLTYYIPFPLSIIHAQQPILQAALLSTYFDNPCGETCDTVLEDSIITSTLSIANTTTETPTTSRLKALSALSMTLNDTLLENIEPFEGLDQTSSTLTAIDLKQDEIFTYESIETKADSIIPQEYSGSGSGQQPIDETFDSNTKTEITPQLNDSLLESNDSLSEEIVKDEKDVRWKIFDFFKNKNNRSDEEIYDEIYNASNPFINKDMAKVGSTQTSIIPVNETTTDWPQVWRTSTLMSMSSSIKLTTPVKRTRFSFFGSAARAKCDAFNQTMCMEWSTDRLLRARLCCLTEVLANDEESGFGCRHFERNKCHRMLPLIKCCLKDFSQLLENYFQSNRPKK